MKNLAEDKSPHVYNKMLYLTYSIAASALLGIDLKSSNSKQLFESFHILISNIFSVPINLPGTSFHKVS